MTATNLGIIVQITTLVMALLHPNTKLRWRDSQYFLNAKEESIIDASDAKGIVKTDLLYDSHELHKIANISDHHPSESVLSICRENILLVSRTQRVVVHQAFNQLVRASPSSF